MKDNGFDVDQIRETGASIVFAVSRLLRRRRSGSGGGANQGARLCMATVVVAVVTAALHLRLPAGTGTDRKH